MRETPEFECQLYYLCGDLEQFLNLCALVSSFVKWGLH